MEKNTKDPLQSASVHPSLPPIAVVFSRTRGYFELMPLPYLALTGTTAARVEMLWRTTPGVPGVSYNLGESATSR